jgi:dynein heavy chain
MSDAVLKCVRDRAFSAIAGKLTEEKFDKAFNNDDTRAAVIDWCTDSDLPIMVMFMQGSDKCVVQTSVEALPSNNKAVYFAKDETLKDQVQTEHFQEGMVTVSEICGGGGATLENLHLLANEVYFPLLSNPANRQGWSGPTSKQVMLQIGAFLSEVTIIMGDSRNQTLLPQPPPEAFDEDQVPNDKDRVHLLETSVIQWTKKLLSVLSTDPIDAINNGDHPGPQEEVDFWAAKSKDLTALTEQLQSEKMMAVVNALKEFKSAYAAEFEKLSESVVQARDEAKENAKYLMTLDKYIGQLSADLDYEALENVFPPMTACLLLIWQKSKTYNTKKRLECFLQEVCNAVISQSFNYINGDAVFRFIEDENCTEAIQNLKVAIKVCNSFKNAFLHYQVKAKEAGIDWDVKGDVFKRLELFDDRCKDIVDFTQIVAEFAKLEKVILGGSTGEELTNSILRCHRDFVEIVEKLQKCPYDMMDINVESFDSDFYKFRCSVKALEKRLSAILIQAFDDAPTLESKFKLLDNFEGLTERPIIRDDMFLKKLPLIQEYMDEINKIQEIFHRNKESPTIGVNMPPVAGAVHWCRSLLHRVMEPMGRLREATADVQGKETQEIENVYEAVVGKLKAYEKEKVAEWAKAVDNTSDSNLSKSLLRRDSDKGLLEVNFDQSLVCLLREVKYLSTQEEIELAPKAAEIFEKDDQYRVQRGNLLLSVSMYNDMVKNLHMVERPLVEKEIAHIDEVLEKAISDLNWNSPDVDAFAKESIETVKKVYDQVQVMKKNFVTIKNIMAEYAKVPLAERKNKSLAPADFEENLRKLWAVRHSIIAEHQTQISELLTQTNEKLGVNKGSPIWRAYVEYVQDHVRDALAYNIVGSIHFLCDQLDAAAIEKNNVVPLLEIKLGLHANDVIYNADDGNAADSEKSRKSGRRDVWQIINDWTEAFFEIGNIMTRMDGSHYVGDLKKNEGIVRYINSLKKHLDWNQKECETHRQEYAKYEFLWKTDRNQEFRKFLANALKPPGGGGDEEVVEEEDGENDDKDPVVDYLPLDKFEEKILYYKELLLEIKEKPRVTDIGFLKVNSLPVQSSIETWISRNIHVYTSYLYNDVTRKLNQMESLVNEVNAGVNKEVKQGDSETLKEVLGYIHKVRTQEKSTQELWQPLRDTVAMLKKYGKNLDDYELKMLANAPMKWEQTVGLVYTVKEKVNNLQNDEVHVIKRKVDQFDAKLAAFRKEFRKEAPFDYEVSVKKAYELINFFHEKINKTEKEAAKLIDLEKVFELNVSKHYEIKRNLSDNRSLKHIWDMIAVVKSQFAEWKKTLWDDIDTDSLLSQCKKLLRQVASMPKDIRGWKCYTGLLSEVKNFQTVLPLVNLLHSPCMGERHWRELKESTGKHFEKNPDFSLSDLLKLDLHLYVEEVEAIVELSTKEDKIGNNLAKIEEVWEDLNFEFTEHAKAGSEPVPIIHQTDDILVSLEENMASLQGMQGQGRYVEHYLDRVNNWQTKLGNTEAILLDWLEVQSKWQSLETIFLGSKDIRTQLPEDSKRFDGIDADFRQLQKEGLSTPRCLDACNVQGRSQLLEKMLNGLEKCEKSLFQYLETKRKIFPRFYFLANAALLDILSNGYDPQCVQKHLGDCFDNLKLLEYTKGEEEGTFTNHAVGMYSKDGAEYVKFDEDFVAEGAVEDWLNKLVVHQQDALKNILSRAKFQADAWETEKPREEWLYDYPAQIALTASQLIWTEETNSAFDQLADGNEQSMKEFAKICVSRLESLIKLVLGKLNKCDRVKVITLITVDVHNRDVVQSLIDKRIANSEAFAWQSQMRYAWTQETKDCTVSVADAKFHYSYEYVGNTGRLVITPLTDRCYITLTQALNLIMGGAPAGPAGTGKTETTKDLGRALGLPVYVFNCSEQMNVHSMKAIYKGLSATGSWGCFDEFNRVPIEVLSVVATQVNTVLNAIRAKQTEFNFMGETCKLIDTVGMFITMNPGYAGRTELPENLKALFRSCAMVVPDIELICENMLMSEGFMGARRLAKKFTTLYSLSKELLSKQMHYDWGLRATKAVLRVAGGLKRAEPNVDEDRILMRALRDFNIPKLVDEDKPIFNRLVVDLFPGLGNTQRKFDRDLEKALKQAAKELKLQQEEMFIMKAIELAELFVIRHSVFIIGPARAGKSEIWKTLLKAFNLQGKKTVYATMNPKAIRNRDLYGYLTKTDWHDGVLSTIMRNMSREKGPYTKDQVGKYIVLDGDIDPDWIESLNTVMDDNKMLTLVSNERIPLSDSMRLLFEISNLDNATPATVSRAGIIFINARDVGFKPFLDSWIESRENEKEKSQLLAHFNKYTAPEFLHELSTQFQRVVPITEVNMIQTICHLLEGVLDSLEEYKRQHKEQTLDEAAEKERFESFFCFACIWALGGACLVDKQNNYQKEFSEWWKRVFPAIKFPKEGNVFDYYPAPEDGKMKHWNDTVDPYVAPDDAYLVTKVFVPTMDTVRLTRVMDLLVKKQRPVHLVGTAGTGKSALIGRYLANIDEEYVSSVISLNYYTDAKALQAILEGPIDKRSGRVFGPPNMKKHIYFLDDLNMPQVDTYGTQSPSALVRQHMDYGTWFDTVKLEKKEIRDVQFLACMNQKAGSFTVNDRLQGNFCTFSTPLPSKESLFHIYNSVMRGHLSAFSGFNKEKVEEISSVIVGATVQLHELVTNRFLPSSKKFHYQFNLRDLSSVLQGVCMSDPSVKFTMPMFARLWEHECRRVFCDRLVSEEDMANYDKLSTTVAMKKEFFKDAIEADIKAAAAKPKDPEDTSEVPLLWTSFHNGSNDKYTLVPSNRILKETLSERLEGYNENFAVMNLELFGAAMEHVCRIARIVANPRGNALLIGVGGSGKQSLARLASYICGYDIFQIQVTATYGMADLRQDLQDLYTKTGQKGMQISFILTDTQVVDDEWLVFINDYLSTGRIQDLYSEEELDAVYSGIRNEAKAAGVPDERKALYDFFIDRVRKNLHLVLCFSPVGDLFRIRCRKFPALINCTAIDWFHAWPRDALQSVSYRFLDDVEMDSDELRLSVSEHMAECHLSVKEKSKEFLEIERRYNYTTPKSFLEFVSFYKDLLKRKRDELSKLSGRLENGIGTILNTEKDVNELKEDLVYTLQKVDAKTAAATELIGKCNIEREKVEAQQVIANKEAKKATAVAEVASKISNECTKDLEKAMPMMEAAKDAVNCLSKASLTTLKSFSNPPGNCMFVTNAVLILRGVPGKKDWAAAKKMMKDVGRFLEDLKNFDAENIDDSVLKQVKPILEKDFFNKEAMANSSEAAANLCGWVVNIVGYNAVYKDVAPKMAARDDAERDLEAARAKLAVVEAKVADMQQKLDKVTAQLDDAEAEQRKVEDEAATCQSRLALAKRLVDGLASEGARWQETVEGFNTQKATIAGDVLLAAAFVSYIGAFNQKFRRDLWQESWLPDLIERKIELTENIDPLFVLSSESDFAKWKNEGLAADRVSLENGAILTRCNRWPLMIDPQLQGIKWIRNRVSNLKVVQLGAKRWLRNISEAVSNGDVVLIEGIGEEIDGTLNTVLSRSTVTRGGQQFIQIGGDEVSYSKDFQLILQTKLANPHYIPEIAAQCTLINFIVTEEGLEDQLLAIVVNKEKPELEEQRTALVRAINDYMVSLTDLENELLERLANAPDDILSDIALIEGLEKTKKKSDEIKQKVELANKQEVSINQARNEFRPVAAETSWIYFLLNDFYQVSYMYQYSLDTFITFFLKAMSKTEPTDDTKERVERLRKMIRFTIFTWVNRGLFEKHKLIFSSQLCFKLTQKGALSEKYNPKLFEYLINAPKVMGVEKTMDWVPNPVWSALQALIKLEDFQRFVSDMEASPNRFKEWYNKGRPESTQLPLEWRKLDENAPFAKLCVVRAMRQDRMTTALLQYVERALPNGKDYTECDGGKSFSDILAMSLLDTTPVNPIFFILSPGADPVQTLVIQAKALKMYDERFHRVALGQGQDVVAMEKLAIGHKEGHWVVLENIHLMPRWCKQLEKCLEDYEAEGSHEDFRVFLTAEPSNGIPIGLLERSIKLTNEPPQGLKQNLKRAFASFDKDEFEFKDPKFKAILFGLCHFHSVIIERIKFGPKGWNRAYPFGQGDLINSAQVLGNYLEGSSDKVPYNDLKYIFGEIMYGGHITDDLDRLLCNTYQDFYIREELVDEMELFPYAENYPDEKFRSPPVLPYNEYFTYIDTELTAESPVAYGLHPNAEIAVKTTEGDEVFRFIQELQPRSAGGSDGDNPNTVAANLVESIMQNIGSIKFNLEDIKSACSEEHGPYQNVFLQECDRMNILTDCMRATLGELTLGLNGELQMSAKMESLQTSLLLGRVPPVWEKLAYPSERKLASWLANLADRAQQLASWTEEPLQIPIVTVLSFLFNPQSFLTAIMQITAQKNKLELDKLTIMTDVTRKTVEETESRARDGAYVTGLNVEGARWNAQASVIDEAIPREMYSPMPVVNCRAQLVEKMEKTGVYSCPVYKTPRRGPTLVFNATLRSKANVQKWILAGACMVLETDE